MKRRLPAGAGYIIGAFVALLYMLLFGLVFGNPSLLALSAAIGIPAGYFVGNSIEKRNAENIEESRKRPRSKNAVLFGLAVNTLVFVLAVTIYLAIS